MPGTTEAATDSTAAAVEKMFTIENLKEEGLDIMLDIGSRLAIAILIIVIGFWITRRIVKVVSKLMEKRNIDSTLRPFVKGFTGFMFKAVVLIIAISTIGVQMTSIIAILGSVGLAIGLALQGSLANFAGGVIILVLKPFKIGEYIESGGTTGVVTAINIFSTTLLTLDNRVVYIPNGPLAGSTITNYNSGVNRRVDLSVGIAYDDKVEDARQAVLSFVGNNDMILKDPAPMVGLTNFGDSSLDLTVRVWCKSEDYWDVFFWMNEEIKTAFDKNNVSIPFPQRDVHMITPPANTNA